jgi:hypothetical protein
MLICETANNKPNIYYFIWEIETVVVVNYQGIGLIKTIIITIIKIVIIITSNNICYR